MLENRNNQNYKRIVSAMRLDKNDVFDIFEGKVSKSKIDAWARSENAIKQASGNSGAAILKRFRPMSDEEFDTFCSGFCDWMRKNDIIQND